MPYISQDRRVDIDHFSRAVPKTVGELNYAITLMCLRYVRRDDIETQSAASQVTYQAVNDVLGALEGAKLEFYRRLAAPYEDTKIVQNGDVYIP